MKANEAYKLLYSAAYDNMLSYWESKKSKTDETKTVTEMLRYWLNLFTTYPDRIVGTIVKYNIEKDFPNAFRNDDNSSRALSRVSGIQPSRRSQRT